MRGFAAFLVISAACGGTAGGPAVSSTTPATPSGKVPAPPTLRLPAGPHPTGYALDLRLDPAEPAFAGRVDIGLDLPPETSFLWLHAKGLTVSAARLRAGAETIPVSVHPGGTDFVGFGLAHAASGAATLHLEYTGPVGEHCCGLFRVVEGGDRYLFTQLESTAARRLVPCFDEPSFKVPWQLTVHVPAGVSAVSNTAVAEEGDDPNGGRRIVFARTRPLPSYLVALAVGPLDPVDAGAGPPPQRVLVPHGRGGDAGPIVGFLPELVGRVDRYLGVPFPYDKLDLAAVPSGMPGAMENAGLIIGDGQSFLGQAGSPEGRSRAAWVLAHEVAHQWLGDLVTPAWWDDVWLSEAAATWIANKVFDVSPGFGAEAGWSERRRRAMATDLAAGARQIRQPIASTDDIDAAFDAITYNKGAAVLAMFERALGADKFQQGVHDYLAAHTDGTATGADFLAALAAAAGTDVAPAFATFLDQPGLPAVGMQVACSGGKGTIELAQSRYVPVGSTAAQLAWQIPVCVKAGAGKRTQTACAPLTGASATIALDFCPAWVHGNAGGAGYYTTVYAPAALAKVAAAGDRLDLAEALDLVDDVTLQMVGGTLAADHGLDALARLAAAAPADVLTDVALAVDQIQDRGLVPGGLAAPFAAWVERVLGARAHALGWQPRPGEAPALRRLRGPLATVVALHGRDKALRDQARALADRWLDDPSRLDPDLAPYVLRVAAWSADEPYLNRVRAAVAKGRAGQRRLLVQSLLEFNDAQLVEKAAQTLLGEDVPAEDLFGLRQLALTGAARAGVAKVVAAHFDAFVAKLGDFAPVLLDSGRPLCDADGLSAYRQSFGDRAARLPGGARRYAQVVERAELCQAARKAQEGPMASALKGK
jgi:alanyl aminopeptidase